MHILNQLQGHILVTVKAVYGTRSGRACWTDRLFNVLKSMHFAPSRADPDVWMREHPSDKAYEYIDVYADDLAVNCCQRSSKDHPNPQANIQVQSQRRWKA